MSFSEDRNLGSVAANETSSISPSISAYGSSPNTPMATSGFLLNLPSEENSIVPPEELMTAFKASKIELTFTKSLFEFSLPCQVIVQPPV